MINNIKKSEERKIQLSMKPEFMSSTDSREKSTTHTKSDNLKIMNGSDIDEIIQWLFDSLLKRHQEGLEESMKGSNFVFDYGDGLNYKCHKTRLTVNHEKIKKRSTKNNKDIEPSTNQYYWNEINFPSKAKDWIKFETNNKSIGLNILFVPHKEEEIN